MCQIEKVLDQVQDVGSGGLCQIEKVLDQVQDVGDFKQDVGILQTSTPWTSKARSRVSKGQLEPIKTCITIALANLIYHVKIARMYLRLLLPNIIENLKHNPAVAILGPRQIGKTTLAFEVAKDQACVYLDLENPSDFQKLQDPAGYFDCHTDKLIILDEVQRYPDLFLSLRGIIDQGRRDGKGNGRFLMLGSASNALLKQSSESLAGRIAYSELFGLNLLEVEKNDPSCLRKLWLRGGFPDSYKAAGDLESDVWRMNFIKTYVERDIPQLGPRIPATTLMRFWTMLAHLQGELMNASKVAGSLGVESVTVSRYLDLMVDLMLVRRLEPWAGNVKKRMVKSPKVYIRDSGLVHSLLKIRDHEDLLAHPVMGKSFEGFVIENILSVVPYGVHAFFYRTAAGAEIDLLLEVAHEQYWAIEIKASRTPSIQKGFHLACDDLRVSERFVVYSGSDSFVMGQGVEVLSLEAMMEKVRKLR